MLKESCIQIAIALLCFTHTESSLETTANPKGTTKSCIAYERSALLDFRASLSDPTNRLSSWEGENCCQWKGVGCSNRTGHVVRLDLLGPHNCFATRQMLGGNISSSLIGLQQLQYLDLSCNHFNSVQIPEFLGSLHDLRYLNLSWSGFAGRIPPQLGNLSNLRYLDLASSTGIVNIYSMDITWLSQLSSLEHLNMDSVNLSTITNWGLVVNMLPSLKVLDLSNCQLRTSHDSLLRSNLTSLETLDISGNNFHKNIARSWFWDLTSLKHFDASDNELYGPFPDKIGNMTSMVYLDLSWNNYLTGMIPSNLKNLCNLEVLILIVNSMHGTITEFIRSLPSCGRNKLTEVYMAGSSLTGRLPTNLPESLRNLTTLQLYENKLTGPVPQWIGELTMLTFLDLSFNNLDGIMREGHFTGLKNLKSFGISDNSIAIVVDSSWVPPFNLDEIQLGSCRLGPKFPAWIRWQKNLLHLDISNTSISDVLPDWFWASSIQYLNMANNQIRGVLPPRMEFMSIIEMNLRSNMFSGPVPKLPINLTSLDLSRNNISGTLPLDFGALGLEILLLFDNLISGSIPSSLCNLQSLRYLDLSGNYLNGSSPECLVNASTSNITSLVLVSLNIRNNNLTGEFPSFLRNCQKLVLLDLAHNQFTGTLPSWIGEKLLSLAFLRLRYNMFYGHVPMALTKLVNIQYLDLAYNNFSGTIPESFVNYIRMTLTGDKIGQLIDTGYASSIDSDETFSYRENFTVVTKGQERLYTGEIVYIVNLDLSCNSFTGDIPEEIGTLVALTNLNLSCNSFTGKIPAKIGSLVQVESLDLSHNELSGKIPTTLSALTSLSHLNLSYNDLSGNIPSGNQLQVLDDQESIYIGNPGLCGPPLTKMCPQTGLIPAAPEDQEDGNDRVFLFLSMVSGYVSGLWIVFCTFLFKAKWRVAWFTICGRLYDWIHVHVVVVCASLMKKMCGI